MFVYRESFSILIFCIFEIKHSDGRNTAGSDNIAFKSVLEEIHKKQIKLIKKLAFIIRLKKVESKKIIL